MKLQISKENTPTKDRIYVWIKDENISNNLKERENRPHKEWEKNVIPKMLDNIKKRYPKTYKQMKDQKWSWSQKCGCDCGCSPGFVGSESNSIIVHITI